MALFYNTDGTISEVIINAIINGKVTSSLATTPTIQQSFEASASNAAAQTANPTRTNRTNTGSLYVKSGATIQKTYSTNSYAVLNPNDPNANKGDTNYWITGSIVIGNYFLSASLVQITTSSLGLGPSNTSAKVAIPVDYLKFAYNSNEITNRELSGLSILPYNGVIKTIENSNQFSSSLTTNYVVMHISASKNNMGNIAGGDLVIGLGTQQQSSKGVQRVMGIYTENGIIVSSSNQAFEAKYPTDKSDWILINGKLTSPKNQ